MTRDNARLSASAVVVATNFVLFLLSFTGTLSYTQGTPIDVLEELSTAHIWTNLFAVSTILGLVAFRRRGLMVDAMGLSAGGIGAWALINWLWGLTATSPVSLAGPAFATALSLIAWALARSWAVTTERGRGG